MTDKGPYQSPRATVPIEAFDDTHPDHAEWVERNGRLFCADDCALHPVGKGSQTPAGVRPAEALTTRAPVRSSQQDSPAGKGSS